jgi:hypothetical protein
MDAAKIEGNIEGRIMAWIGLIQEWTEGLKERWLE